jgi:hypothetical protein
MSAPPSDPLLDPTAARVLRTFAATFAIVGTGVLTLFGLVFGLMYALFGDLPPPCVVSPLAVEWHSCPCPAVKLPPAPPSPESSR